MGAMSQETIERGSGSFQAVPAGEAEGLLREGALAVDVRTAHEHDEQGHIPGSLLLPLAVLASAHAVLPEDDRPVILYCSDGVRSGRAIRRLAEAGVGNLHHLSGGLKGWRGPLERGPSPPAGPSPWLLSHTSLVPPGARTLDVACGRGRHALLMAAAGSMVRAVDRDRNRVTRLGVLARRLRLPLDSEVVDLEGAGVDLGEGEWDLVLVFNYLHRPLFPALVRALRPGGILLYETYTRDQARVGRPTNPDHLLEPGELPGLVAPLRVVREREGEFGGAHLASVAARKA
jgi:rhodanese-related sulfurtransferase